MLREKTLGLQVTDRTGRDLMVVGRFSGNDPEGTDGREETRLLVVQRERASAELDAFSL
jgi:hypothetical protein